MVNNKFTCISDQKLWALYFFILLLLVLKFSFDFLSVFFFLIQFSVWNLYSSCPRYLSSLRIKFKTPKIPIRLINLAPGPLWPHVFSNPLASLQATLPPSYSSSDMSSTLPFQDICIYFSVFLGHSPHHKHMTDFLV